MKILSQEKLKGSQVKLTIEVSKEELTKFFDQALKKLSFSLKIPGFRPGKAPSFIIEQKVGKERISQEALDLVLPESYLWAIKKTNLLPISRPEIKILEFKKETLKYEAIIPLLPEVDVQNWQTLVKKSNLQLPKIKVEPKQVEEVLHHLQRDLASYKEITRPTKKGDWVEIGFESFLGKEPLPSGKSQNHPLIIGQGIFVPGFEEALLGMKEGEEKEFDLIFPSTYHRKELSSKKVHFKVRLNKTKEVILPLADDNLAKKLGKKTLVELKEDIKKSLENKLKWEAEKKFEEELLGYLISKLPFEIPPTLIEEGIDQMLLDFDHQLSHRGLNLEKYLESLKKSKEEFRGDVTPEAEKRIRTSLILASIAKKEKIEVTEKEVSREIKKRQIKEKIEESKDYLRDVLRGQKVIGLIKKAKSEN